MAAVLSRNEIRDRAVRFVADWRDETRERAEAQTFWNEFLEVFGVNRRQVATFEKAAKRASTGRNGAADIFWPEYLLAEHKSHTTPPKDLALALENQAADYLGGNSIPGHQYPRLLIVSDFARFRIRDLDPDHDGEPEVEFSIDELPRNLDRFMFLAGYQRRSFETQDAVDVEAAELLGRVYDELEASGYADHDLRVLIVRVLFLLFADDTGLWERDQFRRYLQDRTAADGRDLGMHLARLFEVLDTGEGARSKVLDQDLARFPYVNGGLFEERIATPDCTRSMRDRLLEASDFDWSMISPAIFGSMFQSVMDPDERRSLGAHYTSEQNILKVIEPLFLDSLRQRLDDCGQSVQKLRNLHRHLGELTFFDPACGCGNFLVIAYRELRRLETDLLTRLHSSEVQQTLDLSTYRRVGVGQFYGIEIEEFPARIAETAMYLIDHLENEALGAAFGINIVDLPLDATAHITVGNALRTDWDSALPAADCHFLFGNPPFAGQKTRNADQTADLRLIFGSGYGRWLDYVTAWYIKAADYLQRSTGLGAFVSTNSITQGEQVALLWQPLLDRNIEIDFAHRTFRWSSEAQGTAQVHCVIIGFSPGGRGGKKHLYEYEDPQGEPHVRQVTRINPYLHDAASVVVASVTAPLSPYLPAVRYGNKPSDGGHLIISEEDYPHHDPIAQKYLRTYIGARELLHAEQRWCIWIPDSADAPDIGQSAFLRNRIEQVRAFRAASTAADTRKYADQPYRFFRIPQPDTEYIAIPRHVAEDRRYFTVAHLPPEVIASDAIYTAVDPSKLIFGLLSSAAFISWMKTVGGRIKSDPRFSAQIVYNTFPLPEVTALNHQRITKAGDDVLAARRLQPHASLAELYDPLAMSGALITEHRRLDRAVDRLFKARGTIANEAERVALLFSHYERMVISGMLPRRKRQRSS